MLTLYYNCSVIPAWWHCVLSCSFYNNPEISWLWNLNWEAPSDKQFIHLLLTFLQHPKRCGRLSIGKFSTIGHFAHLCAQIILNGCLGLADPVSLRYLLKFYSSFFCWTYIWHAYASYLHCLHEMLPLLLKDYHTCSYPDNIGKCIKVSKNILYLLQGLILCPVVTALQAWDFCESSEPIGILVVDISVPSLSITCHYI